MSPSVISGTVIDARGRPVGGARVFIAEAPVPVPDIAALTGENGRFTLTAPAPGRYVVSCAGGEGETSSEEVNLRGDAADVTLRIA